MFKENSTNTIVGTKKYKISITRIFELALSLLLGNRRYRGSQRLLNF